MKVAFVETLGGVDNLKIVDRSEPRAGAGEVLVRLRAASLNYRDLIAIDGGYGSMQKRENLVPLSDGAGEIVAMGDGVTKWRAGDRVVSCFFPNWESGEVTDQRLAVTLGGSDDGVAAEYRVFGEDQILPIPAHLSFAEAAAFPVAGLTAWRAVITQGGIGPGHAVLTQGTGGVSLFALQFAIMAGATVVATSSGPAKLERLRALGARHVINYNEDAKWGQTARKLTDGGADLVVDIGGAQTLLQSLRAVRMAGAISIIGVVTGANCEFPLFMLMMANAVLRGCSVGNRDQAAAMFRAVADHQLRPVIDKTFPLADLRAALKHLKSGRHVGKICIEI
jgi:alcohol dehydrogenase